MVLDRLAVPRPVEEFGQFEELSKLYAIEQPFVPRSQIELQFDVYDGRKLRQSSLMGDALEGGDEAGDAHDVNGRTMDAGGGGGGGAGDNRGDQQQHAEQRAQRAKLRVHPLGHRLRHRKNKVTAINGARRGGAPARATGLSWCRVLFNRNNPAARCCLMSASDTNQELGLLSSSSSGQTINQWTPTAAIGRTSSSEAIQVALAPQPDDERDQVELKAEALRLISGALAGARASHQASHLDPSSHSGGGQNLADPMGPPVTGMEALLASEPANLVSVCLLDKRDLPRRASMFAATNGRRWARASAHLAQLRRKLLKSSANQIKSSSLLPNQRATSTATRQADHIARKVSRRFWFALSKDPAFKYDDNQEDYDDDCHHAVDASKTTCKGLKYELRLDKENTNELVELVKGSLNQLIDVQLLLRNKLTGPQQDPTSSQLLAPFRGAEYDNLLRNNFNLLKIWQNLEETKRLVCFVCEPIKANLADLFWFNRNRQDWPPAQAFDSSALQPVMVAGGAHSYLSDYHNENHINMHQYAALSSSSATATLTGGPGKCLMFVTPLVCLDAGQVKRGLIQVSILESFIHLGQLGRHARPPNGLSVYPLLVRVAKLVVQLVDLIGTWRQRGQQQSRYVDVVDPERLPHWTSLFQCCGLNQVLVWQQVRHDKQLFDQRQTRQVGQTRTVGRISVKGPLGPCQVPFA